MSCDINSCIGVPMDSDKWATPNFTGCEVGSLPPGVCEGFECIQKTPACAVENGHMLKMIKLSNYIDLNQWVNYKPTDFSPVFDNAELLKTFTNAPKKIINGVNTVVTEHCNGDVQVDLVSTVEYSTTKREDFCNFSGTQVIVPFDVQNKDDLQVFINGQLLLIGDYITIDNGSNIIVKLNNYVTDVCLTVVGSSPIPEVVPAEDKLLKVSDTDNTAGYLENKLTAVNGITITKKDFGNSEYLELDVANPVPVPVDTDRNKIVYVDENGNYALGSPCCDREGLVVEGTDGVELKTFENTISFESDDLDITFSDDDDTDGLAKATINLKEGTDLFDISNVSGTQTSGISKGDTIKYTSPDNSIDITINGDNVELKENGDDISYEFTDGETRNINHGDNIKYVSEDLEIKNDGDEHIFSLADKRFGGIRSNGIQIIGNNSSVINLPVLNNHNGTTINGNNELIAQDSGLYSITGMAHWIYSSQDNNASELDILVNGEVQLPGQVANTIDALQLTQNITQYLVLAEGDKVQLRGKSYIDGVGIKNAYLSMFYVR